MARRLDQKKLEAIRLRIRGKSYSEIKKQIKVSKSTLSLWLRRYPLSERRLRQLRDFNEQRIEKFRKTMQLKKENRLKGVYENERIALIPLSKKELYIAGLFLYWGEGGKTASATASLSNTDPKVCKFYLYWLMHRLKVKKEKVVIYLHLYKDMNQKHEISYWSKVLNLHKSQFRKPYIKKTSLRGLTFKGFRHGTCNIVVQGRDLIEKILMGIEAIADEYSSKI